MNLSKPMRTASRFLYLIFLKCRMYLPRQRSYAFGAANEPQSIGPVFVINLDRQPGRWTDMQRELGAILDSAGKPISARAIRYSARDARASDKQVFDGTQVEPVYTLGDQLFVEPQPSALPDAFDLMRPISMSPAEVAIAYSHIGVWRAIAQSTATYALILEDDVLFERGFGKILDDAWDEMKVADQSSPAFDILYVSYKEARYGAPKQLLSKNVFRPERGIWFLSGYILSRKGAQALLNLLPCHGPIDLWINHKFCDLNVRALRRSMISQRPDISSTNTYSILPTLNQIGVLDASDASLFQHRPIHSPVFAFGAPGAGLSSLAMALSMLGYRCCSDLDKLPEDEFEGLIGDADSCVFNAYVNIGSLMPCIDMLSQRHPRAKFIFIDSTKEFPDQSCEGFGADADRFENLDLVRLQGKNANSWRALCEHLRLPPPIALYPTVPELGQRRLRHDEHSTPTHRSGTRLRFDPSPWVVPHAGWAGISLSVPDRLENSTLQVSFEDDLSSVRSERWVLRNDTFPGNLGLFRPNNVTVQPAVGLALEVNQQQLGVRKLGAAAISSRGNFLYGRFEVTLQATRVPGLVTGFFLHRDSPRQEIDIEITGNRPDRLLVNVFYNPGAHGAKFDYGYRGTPTAIPLGFDASKAPHQFAIEWDPGEIRWYVDGEMVHRRVAWNPTPIPHLPMALHVNTWPSNSQELAGRLSRRSLPAATVVSRIAVDALAHEPTLVTLPSCAERIDC